jgi:hypothetical protein
VSGLADFVIVGTMKSGTTTLFRWLGVQPGCALPDVKEPRFFSDDDRWARGVAWYRDLFPGTPGTITGEASVAYTSPSPQTAIERLRSTIPDARLVCVLREPSTRLRSHYAHEVRRGREQRPFDAAATLESPYVQWSAYDRCVGPWIDAFGDQVLVVTFEDLFGPSVAAWQRVLAHVTLAPAERPTEVFNESAGKASFTPVMRRLFDRGIRRMPAGTPHALRRLARRALVRTTSVDAGGALRPEVDDLLRDQIARIEARLGRDLGWTAR